MAAIICLCFVYFCTHVIFIWMNNVEMYSPNLEGHTDRIYGWIYAWSLSRFICFFWLLYLILNSPWNTEIIIRKNYYSFSCNTEAGKRGNFNGINLSSVLVEAFMSIKMKRVDWICGYTLFLFLQKDKNWCVLLVVYLDFTCDHSWSVVSIFGWSVQCWFARHAT